MSSAQGAGAPPRCRPPFFLVVKSEVASKSFFKSAENRAASSLQVGDHRYTSISCASKLLWFQSDFKLRNLELFPGFPGIRRNHGTPGSCFKSAENRATSSPQVGGHRYTSISCASKLLWVQSELKLKNLDFEVASNQLKIGQQVAYGQAVIGMWGFFTYQNCCGFRAI